MNEFTAVVTDRRQHVTRHLFLNFKFEVRRLQSIPEMESGVKVVLLCFANWNQEDSVFSPVLFIYLHISSMLQNCSFISVTAGLSSLLDL